MRTFFIGLLTSIFVLSVNAQDTLTTETADSLSDLDVVTMVADTIATQENESTLLSNVIAWYNDHTNYATITAFMAVESSFIPFPSEVVIPPAAYVASEEGSNLNIFLVILFGTIGALIGAYLNYFLALWLGRPIIYKFADTQVAHWLLIDKEGIEKSEQYFIKHGKVSTLVGRFIPGIRQLISIPAGLSKMNFMSFSIFTFIGALIWNSILALLGYLAHGQKDLIEKYSHELSVIIVVALVVGICFAIVKQIFKNRKKCQDQ